MSPAEYHAADNTFPRAVRNLEKKHTYLASSTSIQIYFFFTIVHVLFPDIGHVLAGRPVSGDRVSGLQVGVVAHTGRRAEGLAYSRPRLHITRHREGVSLW